MSASGQQWPDAFRGFPAGRAPQAARAYMLDLTWESRPSQRFPVAPDGEIPNSVIRQLYADKKQGDGVLLTDDSGQKLRWRSATAAADAAAERVRQQELAELERDWLNTASLEDLEAVLENRRQFMEEQKQAEDITALNSQSQSQSQSPSHERRRRQPRPINLRTLPPIGGGAAAASAGGQDETETTVTALAEDGEPARRGVSINWASAAPADTDEEAEKLPGAEAPLTQPPQPPPEEKKKKKRAPVVKKSKKPTPAAAAGARKTGGTEAATEKPVLQPLPQPQQPQQPQQQLPIQPPPPPPASAEAAELEQPPTPQLLQETQKLPPTEEQKVATTADAAQEPAQKSKPDDNISSVISNNSAGAVGSAKGKRVQFGEVNATANAAAEAAAESEGGKGAPGGLLEQILAEPWFALPTTPPPEKSLVVKGLLLLMKFTVSLVDHDAMCNRLRDVYGQLGLEEPLKQATIDELVAHLQAILDQSTESKMLSELRLRLMMAKGSKTLALLIDLGFSPAELIARWSSAKELLCRQLEEAVEAAAVAAMAAAVVAANEVEAQQTRATSASATDVGGRCGSVSAEGDYPEMVQQLFDSEMVVRLTKKPLADDATRSGGRLDPDEGLPPDNVADGEETSAAEDFLVMDAIQQQQQHQKLLHRLAGQSAAASGQTTSLNMGRDGSSGYGSMLLTDTRESTILLPAAAADDGRGRRRVPAAGTEEAAEFQDEAEDEADEEDTGESGTATAAIQAIIIGSADANSVALTEPSTELRSGSGARTRPVTASVRSLAGSGGSGRGRLEGVEKMAPAVAPTLPDLYDMQMLGKNAAALNNGRNRQPMPQAGFYEEFVPGSDNVIFGAGSVPQPPSGRSTALLLSIERLHSGHQSRAAAAAAAANPDDPAVADVFGGFGGGVARSAAKPAKRVTIQTPTAFLDDDARHARTRFEPFSFMTRSRTEPKLCAASASGRPSYVSSRDWGRLAGGGSGDQTVRDDSQLPTLSRLAWPEHCRMESLARRGLHRPGISISRHLDRYTLIDTVSRGVRVSIQRHAEVSMVRSSASLQNLSMT